MCRSLETPPEKFFTCGKWRRCLLAPSKGLGRVPKESKPPAAPQGKSWGFPKLERMKTNHSSQEQRYKQVELCCCLSLLFPALLAAGCAADSPATAAHRNGLFHLKRGSCFQTSFAIAPVQGRSFSSPLLKVHAFILATSGSCRRVSVSPRDWRSQLCRIWAPSCWRKRARAGTVLF